MANAAGFSDVRYPWSQPFRGRLVLINNEEFADKKRNRGGSDEDAKRIDATFTQLGFTVETFKNQTCVDMLQIMDKVKKYKEDTYDCLVVVILTHGEDGNAIYGVGPEETDVFALEKILAPLKTISNGKPKLIFVQACRGGELDGGRRVEADDDAAKETKHYIRVPMESDFLYHFSTSPGYVSFRRASGSIFIQALCDVLDWYLQQNVEIELLQALTQVNREVADKYKSVSSLNPHLRDKKQMPSFVSMLRKSVYLKKK